MSPELDVDITDQLEMRPERGIDPRRHARALSDLARRMIDEPGSVLSRLFELARQATEAESAGISIEEEIAGEAGVFRWRDLVGHFAPSVGSTMPRDTSPGRTTLDHHHAVLLSRPGRAFPHLAQGRPIAECLLVPMYVDVGAPFGTLWVAHHDDGRHFDASDARALTELATFAGIAHRVAEDVAAKAKVNDELDQRVSSRDSSDDSSRESRYRSLFDAIDAGFCIIEVRFDADDAPVDYRFIETNRAFERQTGLANAVGRWMRDIKPDHEQHWFDLYGRVARNGDPLRFENHAAELGRWYDVHAYRVDRPEDRRVAILFNDITARRTAETQLQQLNARLESEVEARTAERDRLWSLSRDPFLIADPDGRWIRISPAWTEILGWSEQDLVGRTSEWIEHPDDRARTRAEVEALSQGRTTLRFENRFRTKDGDYRWFSWTAVKAEDALYCVARDVTEERQKAEALRVAEEQMRQSQKVEAVGQLTGGVAHDFNNLLTVIRGSIDLMRRPGVSDERRTRYIDAISKTVDRATKLTSQLLAFARRQALKPEVFDAGASVEAIRDMIGTLIGSRIALFTEVGDAPALVNADRSQFDTAIVNMAVNARDAMQGQGRLRIAVGRTAGMPPVRGHPAIPGDFVTLEIEDTGGGIDPGHMLRIFEPFFTTKAIGEGTGLGLSQVIGFAKQSGGDILVESDPGRGSTFKLFLPVAVAPEPSADSAATEREPTFVEGDCVLVVEDNEEVGTFATQALAELGYDVVLAVDGPSALIELQAQAARIGVVFSDVVMPGMSGIELAQEIGRRYPDLPVILTSGYSSALAEGGSHGFELLQKPYSIDALSRSLRTVTRRGRVA